MKKILVLLSIFTAGSLIAAQTESTYNKNVKASEQRVQRLDQLIGKDVTNWQNENIGEISDFVIDKREGKIVYAVLSYGGIASGKKLFAIPFDALTLSPDAQQFILDIPQQRLDQAQGFGERWPAKADTSLISGSETMKERAEKWIDHSKTQSRQRSSQSSNIGSADTGARTPDGEYSAHDYDRYKGAETNVAPLKRGYYGRPPTSTESEYPQATGQLRYSQRGYPETSELSEQHPRLVRASEILGENVVSTQDENLGDVKDLAVDMREGRIPYAIVTHGGFLAMGEKYTAVPWKAFEFRADRNEFVLNTTKDKFANAPTFTNDNWPNFADARWGRQTHQYFNQRPYWETYGYSTYIGQSQQGSLEGWEEFNQKFDPAKVETIEGKITNVSSFTPKRGASEGEQIKIRTQEDKTITVQLGPKSVLSQQNVQFNRGERVKVTGSRSEHMLRSVVIASEIMTQDGKTIRLRDQQGKPVWQSSQGQMSGSEQLGKMDANSMKPSSEPNSAAAGSAGAGAGAGGAASESTGSSSTSGTTDTGMSMSMTDANRPDANKPADSNSRF